MRKIHGNPSAAPQSAALKGFYAGVFYCLNRSYVAAVACTGNFTRAAEQCHVSQPSLSQQIQELEDELGERLFDRMKREAKLTSHGEAFLRRAVRILEEVDAAKPEAKDASELLRGTVTIGVLPAIAPYLLPDVLAEFMEKYPGVEVLPDGTLVTTTYGHWATNEPPYIVSVRLKLEELDAKAGHASPKN